MAVGSFLGQADEPLRSTWLRSVEQILPSVRNEQPREYAWNSALFGGIFVAVEFTEEDDDVDVVASVKVSAFVAFTEDDDDVDAVVYVTPAAVVAFTEADDVVAVVVQFGFTASVAFTEDDDDVDVVAFSYLDVISPESIDAPAIIGPTIEEGTVADELPVIGTIDGSSIPVGPLYIAAEDDPIYTTGMYIRLFAADGVTVLDELEQASDATWLDEANGPGSGSFTLPLSDTATAALCTPGRLVRCYVYGVEAFTWEIGGPPQRAELKPGEEAEETLIFEGAGWAGLLDDVIIEPAWPVGESGPDLSSPFGGRDRVFSFASPDYPNDNWANAYEHYEFLDLQPFRWQTVETLENVFDDLPAPVAMPYPYSEIYDNRVYWIWPGLNFFDAGWAFFRGFLFNPPVGTQFTISVTADNLFILYVDGIPVLGEMADTLMWTGYKEVTVQLQDSRYYLLGAAVLNTSAPELLPGQNPGGWVCASYFPDAQGQPAAPAAWSNSDWKATFSATTWPGWTAAQIILRLLYEGNVRNAVNGAMGASFSAFSDSNGVPWTVLIEGVYTEFVPTFAVRIGSSVLEALIQLHEEGWVNFHMRPGTTVLDMWSYDSPPQNSGVTFERSTDSSLGNLMDVERQPEEQLANALLVAYDDGAATKYVRVHNNASIDAHGKHEEVWDSGATSPEDATRAGQVELRKRAINDEGGAIVAVLEPRDFTEMPYHAFNVLETVAFPSLSGGNFNAVVYSIGVADDGDGNPIFTLELNQRWPDVERSTSRLLRTLGGKTVVSSLKGRL